ncbi:MAG: hypothetical protein HZB53_07745 [Chloroflexi bacterium]|nr:hypothetical protein [Chloroflexota bacterium]
MSVDMGTLWLMAVPAFAALWVVLWAWVGRGLSPELRKISAYETIRRTVAEAAEDGRPVHLALGTAGIADAQAMETVSALNVLDFMSRQSSAALNMPVVTTGHASTLLVAQEIMSRPFVERDHLAQFDPLSARFIGGGDGDPGAAYAAGVCELLDRRGVAANFMLGRFGDEYLLASESATRSGIPQVAGSGNPVALPLMALATRDVLLGEDLFAAGAYLSRGAAAIASLATQDIARWLIIAGIIALAAARTLGRL